MLWHDDVDQLISLALPAPRPPLANPNVTHLIPQFS
jgi:hypothetical protein